MPHRAHLPTTRPPPLKPILACLLLVGLVAGCAGQRSARRDGGAPDAAAPDAAAPAPAGTEWRSDGCATPRSRVAMHTAGVDMPLSDGQTQELATTLTQAGEGRFAAVFAGLELTPDQVRLIVYRKPSAAFDEYLRAAAGDQCVIVRDAPHSQAELLALVDRITGDFAYWRSRGIAINSVGPKHDGSGVEVGTQAVAAARAELAGRYGAAVPIKVVEQGPIVPAVASAR